MAKSLPHMDRKQPVQTVEPVQRTEPASEPSPLQEITIKLVTVSVPYVEAIQGYESRRCDLGRLTAEQQRKLNAIRRGYDFSERRLANGGTVKTLADAVKALIDSIEM